MRRLSSASLLIAALLALGLPACGSASQPESTGTAARAKGGVALKKIGNFDHPVYVAGAPGFPKLLFVVEQPGRVVVLNGGKRLSAPVPRPARRRSATTAASAACSRSPSRPTTARAAASTSITTTTPATSASTNSSARSATRAAAGSQRQVIEIPHPVNANHNGGQMQFLDGLLYFGTGDGGSGGDPPNNAQNKEVLLGKLLRIDPRPSGGQPYSVPSSNPFVGRPGRDEIYSYGLRNPFRFSFDTVSAQQPRIAIGDVGQNKFEELDYTTVAAASGANFGWDAIEGFAPYTEENSGTPDPGGTDQADLRLPPQPRRQLLDHRRLRRQRPQPALSL